LLYNVATRCRMDCLSSLVLAAWGDDATQASLAGKARGRSRRAPVRDFSMVALSPGSRVAEEKLRIVVHRQMEEVQPSTQERDETLESSKDYFVTY